MLRLALPFCLIALPALADTIPAASRITAVTVYPYGAEVTREVSFAATPGPHELLITDLPAQTEPNLIRLAAPQGLTLGAFALRSDRLPPRDEALTPAQEAARAEVERQETALAAARATVDAIEARAAAADAQVAFLAATRAEGAALTPEALTALAQTVGRETLAARQAALAARAELPPAQKRVEAAQKALDQAFAAQDALTRRDEDYAALSVAITAAEAGDTTLTVTHFIADASWQPVYDMKLTRKEGASLTIGRGVLVSQSSGEDWASVALTLSTAQPSQQAEPSQLFPELRRIAPPESDSGESYRMEDMAAGAAPEVMAEPVMEETASAVMQGDVVVYRYPSAVDVASGVENLRLALDEITLAPEIEARAIPRYDRTAFVLARFTNSSGEILLPGQAFLLREGTLVGATWITGIAPGAEAEVAFGAIEGLQLTRDMPTRAEGDRGILSSSTELEEVAVLKVKNLTDETWPVRLLDQVPYSEQEDLEVSHQADPAPTEADVKAQRGILAWDFDIAPGEERVVTLTHSLRWPQGMELQ
ncbi:DUF4139 domain-containing protein [Paracoccaceae bacterium]